MPEQIITIRVYESADEDCVMENIVNGDDRLYAEQDYWCRMGDVLDMSMRLKASTSIKATVQTEVQERPKRGKH